MMSTDAKQFVQCVRAVREYGAEITAMGETLDALFLQELEEGQAGVQSCGIDGLG
jgi:hypothetical protein